MRRKSSGRGAEEGCLHHQNGGKGQNVESGVGVWNPGHWEKDTYGHAISPYGRRFDPLKKAMKAQLGSEVAAQRKIDEYSEIYAKAEENTQRTLNFQAKQKKSWIDW